MSQKKNLLNTFEINEFARDSFLMAIKLVDTSNDNDLLRDDMTAIIVPERMGGEEEDFSKMKKEGFVMPCQCAYKNDTLSIVSALAWEGGFAYISRVWQNNSYNSLMMFGKNRKWKLNGREFKEKVDIQSLINRLVISKALPLKIEELIYGWFDIKTPGFYEIQGMGEELEKEQHILRIYFSCRVWPEIF